MAGIVCTHHQPSHGTRLGQGSDHAAPESIVLAVSSSLRPQRFPGYVGHRCSKVVLRQLGIHGHGTTTAFTGRSFAMLVPALHHGSLLSSGMALGIDVCGKLKHLSRPDQRGEQMRTIRLVLPCSGN